MSSLSCPTILVFLKAHRALRWNWKFHHMADSFIKCKSFFLMVENFFLWYLLAARARITWISSCLYVHSALTWAQSSQKPPYLCSYESSLFKCRVGLVLKAFLTCLNSFWCSEYLVHWEKAHLLGSICFLIILLNFGHMLSILLWTFVCFLATPLSWNPIRSCAL